MLVSACLRYYRSWLCPSVTRTPAAASAQRLRFDGCLFMFFLRISTRFGEWSGENHAWRQWRGVDITDGEGDKGNTLWCWMMLVCGTWVYLKHIVLLVSRYSKTKIRNWYALDLCNAGSLKGKLRQLALCPGTREHSWRGFGGANWARLVAKMLFLSQHIARTL